MLELQVKIKDDWNAETEKFEFEHFELQLEHSLVSLSKWEQIHEKAYLGPIPKTDDEVASYIHCMIITKKYPSNILDLLIPDQVRQIEKYINAKMTATTVNDMTSNQTNEIITNELIYYWIFSYEIPLDVEHWHLNRLFMLLRLFGAKQASQQKKKRMSATDVAQRNRMLNEQRRAASGSKG